MARAFSSTSDHLDNTVPAVTATPLSISFWFKPGSVGTAQNVMNIGQAATQDQRWSLNMSAAGNAQILVRDTANTTTTSTVGASAGAWGLFTATFTDDTNRAVYFNGANKATSAVLKAITAPTNTRLSASPSGVNPILNSGYIAHLAIWNIALSDADVLALVTNLPSSIQVSALQEYWSLANNASPEPSTGILGNSLTVTGTVFATDDPFGTPPLLMGQAIF